MLRKIRPLYSPRRNKLKKKTVWHWGAKSPNACLNGNKVVTSLRVDKKLDLKSEHFFDNYLRYRLLHYVNNFPSLVCQLKNRRVQLKKFGEFALLVLSVGKVDVAVKSFCVMSKTPHLLGLILWYAHVRLKYSWKKTVDPWVFNQILP